MRFAKWVVITLCILFTVLCFLDLGTFTAAGTRGLALIYRSVLPVLFPFFLITGLVINVCETSNKWTVTALAFFSGYPNGMRMAAMLYERGSISREQACHMTTYTSTVSPIFVIATVGTVMLGDTVTGVLIFAATILGALLNGIIWRQAVTDTPQKTIIQINRPVTISKAWSDALLNAVSSVLNVCGVILFFYIAAAVLGLPPFLSGIIEMTTGVSGLTNPLLIEFIVSFGGISIAMQGFTFTKRLRISPVYYFGCKITHAVIATGILGGIFWFGRIF
jgi:hypothetical protein